MPLRNILATQILAYLCTMILASLIKYLWLTTMASNVNDELFILFELIIIDQDRDCFK